MLNGFQIQECVKMSFFIRAFGFEWFKALFDVFWMVLEKVCTSILWLSVEDGI